MSNFQGQLEQIMWRMLTAFIEIKKSGGGIFFKGKSGA